MTMIMLIALLFSIVALGLVARNLEEDEILLKRPPHTPE
jgi:hypothetical protein